VAAPYTLRSSVKSIRDSAEIPRAESGLRSSARAAYSQTKLRSAKPRFSKTTVLTLLFRFTRGHRCGTKRKADDQCYLRYLNATTTTPTYFGGETVLSNDGRANFRRNVHRLLRFAEEVWGLFQILVPRPLPCTSCSNHTSRRDRVCVTIASDKLAGNFSVPCARDDRSMALPCLEGL
jgi:hypothetical protein